MPPTPPARPSGHNRLRALLVHTSRYSFDGAAKLARDVGVSRSTISRIMTGRSSPSLRVAQAITDAIGAALKRKLRPEDIFSPDGFYEEPSTCLLAGCKGCMPEAAFDRCGRLKPEYQKMKPGDWTRFPQRGDKSSISTVS